MTQIGNILCALLPLSLFVCLSQKGVMNDKFFTVAGIVLVVFSILQYYHYERIVLMNRGTDDGDVTNNSTTAFLMLIPMVFLFKSNIQKWATLLLCLFFLIMGAKRGNIIAAFIPVLLFVRYVLKDSRHSAQKTILVFGGILVAAFFTYRWVASNEYLMYRFEQTQEGNSSGRDVIYAGAWHTWYDSDNFANQLFGLGFDGILRLEATGHHHAHNDWLEVLVNYGLLGVLLYLAVLISLFLQVRKIRSFEMRMTFLSGLLIWFLKTLYSMGFTAETLSVAMISIGTVLGWYKTEKNQA
jgi:O-antigen ligase